MTLQQLENWAIKNNINPHSELEMPDGRVIVEAIATPMTLSGSITRITLTDKSWEEEHAR